MRDIKLIDPKEHANQGYRKFWAEFSANLSLNKKEEDLARIGYLQGYIDSSEIFFATLGKMTGDLKDLREIIK